MLKIPVIIRPNYIVYIEDFQGSQFLHCDVFKWNKTVFKQLKQDWETLKELHGGPLYCLKEEDTTGYLKFIKSLGFKLLKPMISFSGKEVYIYYWSK